MPAAPTQSYSTAPVLHKILFWVTLVAFGFVLFHMVMTELLDREANRWVSELYMTLIQGLPFFLFLTGASIRHRVFRIPLLLFLSAFFVGWVITQLDFHDIVDWPSMSRLIAISATGLLLTYLAFVVYKLKSKGSIVAYARNDFAGFFLDLVKPLWLIAISVAVIGIHVQWGKVLHPLRALQCSLFLFPVLMMLGLYVFYRKPR